MTARQTYDVIVVGIGGMGSATVYELASRGLRVLGLEQFDIPHDQGSSHGINRVIRLAYYEDPSYVPLVRRAFERWHELEAAAGEKLLYTTGSVAASREDHEVFTGSLRSCLEHDLPHEALTSRELSDRFPGHRLPPDFMGLLQPDGGFLLSERCIVDYVFGALERGADIRAREAVLGWDRSGDAIQVETSRGKYEAGALVITAGAWTGTLTPSLAHLAIPERQVLGWFQPLRPEWFTLGNFPVTTLAVDEGHYYALPVYGIPGFKIGRYHHLEETSAADNLDRVCRDEDEEILRLGISRYFPDANGPTLSMKVCMFTNTPDEHFIIDALPGAPNVFVAAGFSGHGFKFCSVVGEIMSDLATMGETPHDISLLSLNRFEDVI